MAASAAEHVPAQVAFAALFAAALTRRGLLIGSAAGTVGYAGASFCLAHLPDAAALALAAPALALAPRLHPPRHRAAARPRSWSATALTCGTGSIVVPASVFTSRAAGPAIGGAVAAFPTMSGTLAAACTVRGGTRDGANVLLGLVRSLPCYLAFFLIVALTAPVIGVLSLPLAALTGIAVAVLNWRWVSPRARQRHITAFRPAQPAVAPVRSTTGQGQ